MFEVLPLSKNRQAAARSLIKRMMALYYYLIDLKVLKKHHTVKCQLQITEQLRQKDAPGHIDLIPVKILYLIQN